MSWTRVISVPPIDSDLPNINPICRILEAIYSVDLEFLTDERFEAIFNAIPDVLRRFWRFPRL